MVGHVAYPAIPLMDAYENAVRNIKH